MRDMINTDEPDEVTENGLFANLIQSVGAIVGLAALESPVLLYAWNLILPVVSGGRIGQIDFWQSLVAIFTYNVLTLFQFKNLMDGPPVVNVLVPSVSEPTE